MRNKRHQQGTEQVMQPWPLSALLFIHKRLFIPTLNYTELILQWPFRIWGLYSHCPFTRFISPSGELYLLYVFNCSSTFNCSFPLEQSKNNHTRKSSVRWLHTRQEEEKMTIIVSLATESAEIKEPTHSLHGAVTGRQCPARGMQRFRKYSKFSISPFQCRCKSSWFEGLYASINCRTVKSDYQAPFFLLHKGAVNKQVFVILSANSLFRFILCLQSSFNYRQNSQSFH